MQIAALIVAAATAVIAAPAQLALNNNIARETADEAVGNVANLLKTVTTGALASVYPETAGPNADAPCHPDGGITFIALPISLMQRNLAATHGAASYSVNTPLKKGISEYGQPRVGIVGNFTVLRDVEDKEHERLAECYVQYHPDAKWWLPSAEHGAHTAYWARLDPQDLYYVGGFGDTRWIGHIPLDKYKKAMNSN